MFTTSFYETDATTVWQKDSEDFDILQLQLFQAINIAGLFCDWLKYVVLKLRRSKFLSHWLFGRLSHQSTYTWAQFRSSRSGFPIRMSVYNNLIQLLFWSEFCSNSWTIWIHLLSDKRNKKKNTITTFHQSSEKATKFEKNLPLKIWSYLKVS